MLRLDNLNVYYGESHILRNVSLEAEAGQVLCLMGRNGVGKTTVLKTVTGLLAPRSGRVFLDGHDVTGESPDRRVKRGLAYVPQGREILPHLTVKENLRLGFWARPGGPNGVAEAMAFEEVFALFPKLAQLLERPGGVLSGGEQQQVAIARALLSKPRILLLDEPTEGIQPSIIKQIERVIRVLASQGNIAILLVEQYYEFARGLAQRTAVMSRGEIVLAGVPGELDEAEVRRHLTV